MKKYAHVQFTHEEAELQREFLKAMNGTHIIMISANDIDEDFEDFLKEPNGRTDVIVLHNKDEVTRFKYVMRTFFPDKKYEIRDKEFD